MAQLTAHEQYLLEMINRARLDPGAEAARYGIDLNQGLASGTLTTAAKQPLAFDAQLTDAARAHSEWMLDTDTFSHTGSGGSSPGDRMEAAGYVFSGSWSWGENIAWNGTTGTLDVTRITAEEHASLFRSSGHRLNILNDSFREVGLGAVTGEFAGYKTLMASEEFTRSGTNPFVTGVAYGDADHNGFYTPGEGHGGVLVAVRGSDGVSHDTTTIGAGGYESQVPAGSYAVTFSGAGLPQSVGVSVAVGSQNVKVDLVGTNAVQTSVNATLGANAKSLTLLGNARLEGNGNAGDNVLHGNAGDNVLRGGAGHDFLNGGAGNDRMEGGSGNDTYVVVSGGDSAVEGVGQGIDTIESWRSLTLPANIEILKLMGGSGLSGTGNAAGNVLIGNTGDNVLTGGGGADRLTGGAGADRFVYGAITDQGDTITDFSRGAGDRLDFSRLFDSLGYGGSDPVADHYLRAVDAAGGAHIQIDATGGDGHFVDMVTLSGTTTALLGTDYAIL